MKCIFSLQEHKKLHRIVIKAVHCKIIHTPLTSFRDLHWDFPFNLRVGRFCVVNQLKVQHN